MQNILDNIKSPNDLKELGQSDLLQLANELRHFIINAVAAKEGHLGASLGVVELTIALHYLLDTPHDRLIWDVGHQAYGHKLLTGRRARFHTNREFGGISGFPKRSESEYDAFGTGHSSTSISAIIGMALANRIKDDKNRKHIAVIGDASIASGMAFEALNHLGETDLDVTIILNDNAIGIDPSVGALKTYLTRTKKGHNNQGNIFEELNLNYTGPVDGHDLRELIKVIDQTIHKKGPQLLHVVTTKGKGLPMAEKDQVTYHAPGKFDPQTGQRINKPEEGLPPKFQDVFGHTIVELAKTNPKIVGITPAMPSGSSLKYMIKEFPERAFDVGIAEQHAVTMAAGLASEGMAVFCTIYSTFLQRAYDQIIHDVALQNLPVIFCIDRAGLVGQDGPTHHGAFDLAYLNCIPNLIIFSPYKEADLRNMMFTAQKGLEAPLAIRYPRGRGHTVHWKEPFSELEIGKCHWLQRGNKVLFITLGPIGHEVTQLLDNMPDPKEIGHLDLRFLKPLDAEALKTAFQDYEHIITLEDGCLIGGLASTISDFARSQGFSNPIKSFGLPDEFIPHGKPSELREKYGLDSKALKEYLETIGIL